MIHAVDALVLEIAMLCIESDYFYRVILDMLETDIGPLINHTLPAIRST